MYAVLTFGRTLGDLYHLPQRDAESWERALLKPTEHTWIVEFYLRLRIGVAGSRALVVSEDWDERDARATTSDESSDDARSDTEESASDASTGGFLDVDAIDRLEMIYAACERAMEANDNCWRFVDVVSEEFEKGRRSKGQRVAELTSPNGEPIGADAQNRRYYAFALDARLFRVTGEGDDSEWCTPFVTLSEVKQFAQSMDGSTNEREIALHEYLKNDHIPFHEDRAREREEEAERAQAKREAKAREEARRLEWELTERKRSSRLESKRAQMETTVERVPETLSPEERESVLAELRDWILTPASRRKSSAPPREINIDALVGETLRDGTVVPRVEPKPKGRKWNNCVVCVHCDEDHAHHPNDWHEGIVMAYEPSTERSKVYFPCCKLVDINLDNAVVRVGGVFDANKAFTLPGQIHETLAAMLRESRESTRRYTGCWRDAIAERGLPSWFESARTGDTGALFLAQVTKRADEDEPSDTAFVLADGSPTPSPVDT